MKHLSASARTADLKEKLRRSDRRITGPRRAILDVLSRHPHPMTTRQIRLAMTECACDLVTVYRSVKLLVEMELVDRFDFGDGSARFELAGNHNTMHHHHLICTRCDEVVEIEECFTNQWEERITRESGFIGVTHKLEFFGVCPDCQKPSAQSRVTSKSRKPCGC